MAHFRGTISGVRGDASRLGHKKTGLTVKADSWDGGVRVELEYDPETGRDRAIVTLTRGSGSGGLGDTVVFSGFIDDDGRTEAAGLMRVSRTL